VDQAAAALYRHELGEVQAVDEDLGVAEGIAARSLVSRAVGSGKTAPVKSTTPARLGS
jgi:hypothetical protein